MLLRNLDPSSGLCNGTRMICRGFSQNVLHAEISTGHSATKHVFLPRIQLSPPENEGYPFKFIRKQFPIRLCFAMTINKAQGQTIHNVGLYLPQHVFSHGQLKQFTTLVCICHNMFSHMVNCTCRYQEGNLCPQLKYLS